MQEFQPGWHLFPNGQVWHVGDDLWIEGVVAVPNYEEYANLDDLLDAIAEAATGSIVGLSNFSCTYQGGDRVVFSGSVGDLFDVEEELGEDDPQPIEPGSPRFRQALREMHGLSEAEAEHAIQALIDCDSFQDERRLAIAGSARALHVPKDTSAGMYARVVVAGCFEVLYLDASEFGQDPAATLASLLQRLDPTG
jgi:hypothetical protein